MDGAAGLGEWFFGGVESGGPEGHGPVEVAVDDECIHALKDHQERQQAERAAARHRWTESRLVFANPTGGPLDPANLTRRFNRLLDRAGLRRIHFHDLRHTTATLLLEQGVELVVIKDLLGHAHIGVALHDDGPDEPPPVAPIH
ncbi:tyrosine-type recombinase/integrase [Streptomyces flaveus]